MRRVAAGQSAFGDRGAPFLLSLDSIWKAPEDSQRNIAWTRAAYGANYDRLVELKNKYDPGNFFRMNQNVRPSR